MPKEPGRQRRARGEHSAARTRRGSLRTEGTAQSFPSAAATALRGGATAGPGRTEPSRAEPGALPRSGSRARCPQVSGSGAVRPRTDTRTYRHTDTPPSPYAKSLPVHGHFSRELHGRGARLRRAAPPSPGSRARSFSRRAGGRGTDAQKLLPPPCPAPPSPPVPARFSTFSLPPPAPAPSSCSRSTWPALQVPPRSHPRPSAAGAPGRLLRLSPRWLRTQLPRLLSCAERAAGLGGGHRSAERALPRLGERQSRPQVATHLSKARRCPPGMGVPAAAAASAMEVKPGGGAGRSPALSLTCSSRGTPPGRDEPPGTSGPPS